MKKKLKLSRELIARLTSGNLTRVVGGNLDPTLTAEPSGPTCPIGQGSYVHQGQVYPCNKSAGCEAGR
ncbi:MAG TPA: hypothetical protein VIU61_06745 [Kofleriaceae bacterium]